MDLNSAQVSALARIVEEATRADPKTIARFVEPAHGTLDRAKSARPHIVFGRRGSGKSSLLRKAYAVLSLERKPAAYVDLEAFKGHSYPDVLLSVLIASLSKFEEWLETTGSYSAAKKAWWDRLFASKPSAPPIDKSRLSQVKIDLVKIKTELESLLYAQDGAAIDTRVKVEQTTATSVEGGVDLAKVVTVASTAEEKRAAAVEQREQTQRNKTDVLHRSIMRFQKLYSDISTLGKGSAYLFLDDLYHLRREDQASVLDYFHRIAKNNGVWIKCGSIRHRTDHYRHGNPPTGMKLGDDADEIDLDLTLEKYQTTKAFLVKVLTGLFSEAGIDSLGDVITDTALDRLVVASGGVARDFLTIFRKSIDFARERGGNDARGPRIGGEDVNRAAGEHDTSKRDELRRDAAQEETSRLEAALAIVRQHCLEDTEVNCFLIERDIETRRRAVIDELLDLKMLHLVHSRVTIPVRQGKYFTAYMLDLSQYTGDRKRRNLEMLDFSADPGREALRRVKLIFDLTRIPLSADHPQPGTAQV